MDRILQHTSKLHLSVSSATVTALNSIAMSQCGTVPQGKIRQFSVEA